MTTALLLVSHGTVTNLDDLGAFVTKVRRGHAPPPELIVELRRRYEAIGGTSPLNAIHTALSNQLASRLGCRVAWANRLWSPSVRDVLDGLSREGMTRVVVLPLAQYSTHVYEADARESAEGLGLELACVGPWGQDPGLCTAFASRIGSALRAAPAGVPTAVVMTAHSLPRWIVLAGDPYEQQVRAAAEATERLVVQQFAPAPRFVLAFQSQGMTTGSRPVEWLGPDLVSTLDEIRARGDRHVVFAPIGFLADHLEILYDLDIEAANLARDRGLSVGRAASLNAADDFVDVLVRVTQPLLAVP